MLLLSNESPVEHGRSANKWRFATYRCSHFMFVLIEARYRLTISNIKFKIALLEANEALANEKSQSDKLLRNILPDEVADELKSTGKANAKHYKKFQYYLQTSKGLP